MKYVNEYCEGVLHAEVSGKINFYDRRQIFVTFKSDTKARHAICSILFLLEGDARFEK